ncbi:ATP-binding protein [Streptomyces profundus]|uniref:ATP-binding protein n=1 Tax=Streptomyces profundus TaxID=2867410 RepID=UPI001D16DDDD|nr:ATP-binding protein [Streptomyces sp. MA3_2.13]UED85837.1 ATP-binding protein [Streptomyces sp. MA3_2.13]
MTSLRTPTEAVSVGHPTYSQTLPCEPSTAEIGRELVRGVLGVWHLDDLADQAALVVTELIANAARHTSCVEIHVVLGRPSATRVRVGVVDEEPSRLPELGCAGESDESGRGLFLIEAVADGWGCEIRGTERCPWGKEVWAELRTEGAE